MAKSLFGSLASTFFKAGRAASKAHLAESVLTGNTESVERSLKTRARYRAKTMLWHAIFGKRR